MNEIFILEFKNDHGTWLPITAGDEQNYFNFFHHDSSYESIATFQSQFIAEQIIVDIFENWVGDGKPPKMRVTRYVKP